MRALGFLHTSASHVPTFRGLVAERDKELTVFDTVDEGLLAEARRDGVDEAIRARLEAHLLSLRDHGAAVILCTCSTLAGQAEEMGRGLGVPVIRVDRPMAERAASLGGRIVIVAALASTLMPTRRLLEECIDAVAADALLIEAPCPEAWELFESGRTDAYLERIARHAWGLADRADVIVLAQASMDGATLRLGDLGAPVLSSPATAFDRAIEVLGPSGGR